MSAPRGAHDEPNCASDDVLATASLQVKRVECARRILCELIATKNVNFDAAYRASRVNQILVKFAPLCRERDQDGYLPLHVAVRDEAPLQVLVELASCYPHALAEKGGDLDETPLHIACDTPGSVSLQFVILICTEAGDQEDHGIQPLHTYCKAYGPHAVHVICKEAVRSLDKNKMLPLHRYCDYQSGERNLEVVKRLIEAYPESIREVDQDGCTPLLLSVHTAIRADIPIIEYLQRLYPGALTQRNHKGCMPLHRLLLDAEESDAVPVMDFFINNCRVSAKVLNRYQSTLLHVLLKYSIPDPDIVLPIARLLRRAYPGCVTKLNKFGRTPLHLACERTNDCGRQIIHWLVRAYPQALKIRDENGATPLQAALTPDGPLRNTRVIKFLVRKCPEVLETVDTATQDKHGLSTPLVEFCKSRVPIPPKMRIRILKILAISDKALQARDRHGRMSLHCLSLAGNVTSETLKVLVKTSPDLPSVADYQGRIPLHLAVLGSVKAESPDELRKYKETVRALLEHHPAGSQAQDIFGTTPLDLARRLNVGASIAF